MEPETPRHNHNGMPHDRTSNLLNLLKEHNKSNTSVRYFTADDLNNKE